MNENPLITVIIPVYNIQEYITRCVQSICSQQYTHLEIILVDDGSTDDSGRICDALAEDDSRINVIHKKNGGLSDARNVALDVAKGDYIVLVDGDDFVSKYYVSNLMRAISVETADMAVSWFENVLEGTSPKTKAKAVDDGEIELLSSSECVRKMLYQDGVETSAWGKLYKKELFNELRYPKGKLYEDILVTYETIHRCKKIAFIKNVDYYYFQRKTSIQYQKFSLKKLDAVNHIETLRSKVLNDYPDLAKAADCRCFSTIYNILFQIGDEQEYKDLKEKLLKKLLYYRKNVLSDDNARKKAKAGAILTYFGYPVMRFVYRLTQFRGK